MDAEPDLPDIREDDPRWVRCAVYTRQSVKRSGDNPAVTSCALQRTLCTEFICSKTWDYWYPNAERFDDEGESGATLERPGLSKLLRRIEEGDVAASSCTASIGSRGSSPILHDLPSSSSATTSVSPSSLATSTPTPARSRGCK